MTEPTCWPAALCCVRGIGHLEQNRSSLFSEEVDRIGKSPVAGQTMGLLRRRMSDLKPILVWFKETRRGPCPCCRSTRTNGTSRCPERHRPQCARAISHASVSALMQEYLAIPSLAVVQRRATRRIGPPGTQRNVRGRTRCAQQILVLRQDRLVSVV